MKKIITLLLSLCLPIFVLSQSQKEELEILQGIYGKEKKTIVADFVIVEGAKGEAFWKLYDEYETKRKALGQERVALMEKYASNYEKLDDAVTSKIIRETADLGARTDKLVLTYYKKMEKEAGVKPAAQFYELELYFLSAIRAAIFETIPVLQRK